MIRYLLTCFVLFKVTLALSSSTTLKIHENVNTAKVSLTGIDPSQFRHPLDRDLTSFVKRAPLNGLAEEAIRRSFPLLEQGVRLDLLATAVKVSPDQLPHLHASLLEACRILDLTTPPDLYVQSSPQANAYTLALQGRDTSPIVVVTSALIDRCTEEEVQAILGHELGHLKCEHSLYLTLGGLASTPLRGLPFVGSQTESLLERWRLAAEYSCDRAALLVAQDASVVAGAMLKLFAGTSKVTNVDAFIAQCLEYNELLQSANPFVRASVQMQQSRTHPLPVRRVAELEKWFQSDEYTSLVVVKETDKEHND